MVQFPLDFQPGLTVRFPRWEDTFVGAVYSARKGLNGVAADLDMSPSELSKRLSHHSDPNEPRPLRSQDILGIIKSTGDMTPIHWLVEYFLEDPTAKREQAMTQIAALVPLLQALTEQAALQPTPKRRGTGRSE